jgi:hypothetical protein
MLFSFEPICVNQHNQWAKYFQMLSNISAICRVALIVAHLAPSANHSYTILKKEQNELNRFFLFVNVRRINPDKALKIYLHDK